MKRMNLLTEQGRRNAAPPGNGGRGLKHARRVRLPLDIGCAPRQRGARIET